MVERITKTEQELDRWMSHFYEERFGDRELFWLSDKDKIAIRSIPFRKGLYAELANIFQVTTNYIQLVRSNRYDNLSPVNGRQKHANKSST